MSNKKQSDTPKKLTTAQQKIADWKNTSKALEKTVGFLNPGNIGDSIESRLTNMHLGGGSDGLNGVMGLSDYWPAQGDGVQTGLGMESDSRFSGLNERNNPRTRAAWSRIKMCRQIYDSDGQIASIIDLMADFATEGISFIHKSKSVEKFFKGWQEQVKLSERFRRGIIDILLSGAVFWYRVYATLEDKEVNALKSFSVGQSIGKELVFESHDGKDHSVSPKILYTDAISVLFENDEEAKKEIEKIIAKKLKKKEEIKSKKEIEPTTVDRKIPWEYISLNPLQMFPNDKGGWSYLLTKGDIQNIKDKLDINFNESNNALEVNLPEGIAGKISKINDTGKSGFYAEMALDNTRLVYIPLSKFDWAKWPIPMLWKAVPTIVFKNTLRAMELKTAQSAINTVTLWKLGDHKEGLMPDAGHFERLADMLKAPSSTLNVLWSSAISAEVIQPKMDQIFDTKRWEEIRKEITAQFGISQAVTTGEGGNFSSSYISVQGLVQKLQTLRDLMLSTWLQPEVKLIAKAMGFRKMPRILFGNMSLRDEKAEKQLVMNLLDRGYLSDETAMNYLGLDVDVERRRILDQNKFDDENDMVRRGPFMVQDGQTEIVQKQLRSQEKMAENNNKLQEKQIKNDDKINHEKIKLDHKVKLEQARMGGEIEKHMARKGQHPKQISARKPKNANGRPPGSGKPQVNKRTPKPRNVASVDVMNFINNMDLKAKEALISVEKVPLYKGLSKAGKASVLDLVAINTADFLYDDYVEPTIDSLKDSASLIDFTKDEVHGAFITEVNKEMMNFKQNNTRKPTKAELYQIYAAAFMKLNEQLNSV